ncbi:hypothetical protein Tco_0632873 [Tanacetum coccineum]
MSSITAQQTKLDLELVPKENRLDIEKCNGRIPRGLTPREPTFQVILDAIALTPGYPKFLITADVPERYLSDLPKSTGCINPRELLLLLSIEKNVDYVELLWEEFIYQIDNRVDKKQEKMYYPRFTKVIIHHFLIQDTTLSWRNKIGMHTSKDDYLINSLRFVFAKESTQIYGAILPECLTSPVMKESKAYKTYLGYATDEEPIQKGKRVKRPAKKSTTKPAAGVVIKEAHVETKSKSKEKEKVDVSRGKGIELLSEVALTEEAQMKEVRKKSLRDFYKTHPSGSGIVAKKPQSVDKITPTITSEGTSDKPGVPDVTEDDSTESSEQENKSEEQESDSEQEEESEDDDQEGKEFVHTPTDDKDDDYLESESYDVIKSDEEKGMDDTTYQFNTPVISTRFNTKKDTMYFLRDLGHTGDITLLNDVVVYPMHQPWRTFVALINRSLSGKTNGLDKLRLSRAQII